MVSRLYKFTSYSRHIHQISYLNTLWILVTPRCIASLIYDTNWIVYGHILTSSICYVNLTFKTIFYIGAPVIEYVCRSFISDGNPHKFSLYKTPEVENMRLIRLLTTIRFAWVITLSVLLRYIFYHLFNLEISAKALYFGTWKARHYPRTRSTLIWY